MSRQCQNSGDVADFAAHGTSLVVRLFWDIVNRRVEVHRPANEFRTVRVVADERYCLKCCAVRVWDVWHGLHEGLDFALGRCRVCGKEQTL